MKLKSIHESLVLEIYNNLDDISKITKNSPYDGMYTYKWNDKDTNYIVSIGKDIVNIEEHGDIPVWGINLKSDDTNEYAPTNKGNFGSVYKNMLSSLKDFITSEKPLAISFSAYTSGMSLIYDKFMKKFLRNKNNPHEMFYKYNSYVYVSQALIDSLDDEKKKQTLSSIDDESELHDDDLKSIKHQLNYDRTKKLERTKINQDDNESNVPEPEMWQ